MLYGTLRGGATETESSGAAALARGTVLDNMERSRYATLGMTRWQASMSELTCPACRKEKKCTLPPCSMPG